MNRQCTAVAFAALVALASPTHAKNVPVYYPEGHYLGCGEPAADGSGIWSVDPRCPESECHDIVAPPPNIEWFVGLSQLTGYESLATRVFEPLGTVRRTKVDPTTQIGAGAIFRPAHWLGFEVGAGIGDGAASAVVPLGNLETRTLDTDLRVVTGSAGFRLSLPSTHIVQPHLSFGARGLVLRPRNDDLRTASTVDLTTGAGVELRLTPRLGVDISGVLGFGTGWSAGASLVYRGWKPRHPAPCAPGEMPPCNEWGPYGPRLPFAYPIPGMLHREGLDVILSDIQSVAAVPPARPRTRADLLNLIEASTNRFLRSRGMEVPQGLPRIIESAAATEPLSFTSVSGLSAGQQRHLAQLDAAIEGTSETLSAAGAFQDAAKRALRDLGPAHSQVVVIAASVAAGSQRYWVERGEDWRDAIARYINDDALPPAGRVKWKEVLRADARSGTEGAIGGAIAGRVAGGVAGGVTGAVVGGIGGAVAGSAAEVVGQLLN